MNEYEKAINYFYSVMEKGNIRNDAEQESFETAIKVLEKESKVFKIANEYTNPSNKYYLGDIVPNLGRIKDINRESGILFYKLKKENGNIIVKSEKEIDDVMIEYYRAKR